MNATALIAEDEPLLADYLRSALALQWPELDIVASVGNGQAALDRALVLQPDVLFLDIRMPGLGGLDVAEAVVDEWSGGRPPPLVVFVTAYEQYAIDAFERAAADYLLKPVASERLMRTCARLRAALETRKSAGADASAAEATLARLRELLGTQRGPAATDGTPLRMLQAAHGSEVRLIAIDEVLYFEAADKYVRVVTAEREYLIRTALRELLPRLDPGRFWQIHRSVVVRADAVDCAMRDESGKLSVSLRGHPDRLAVSRLHAHRFKAM